MKIAFYLNSASPHQMPLAKEIVRLVGECNFKYVYSNDLRINRKSMGWDDSNLPDWCVKGDEKAPELLEADLVYTGVRCFSLMLMRSELNKKTAYYSERWFKPIPLGRMLLPGSLRLLSPCYVKMAKEMVRLLNKPSMRYLSCGPLAADDLSWLGLKASQIVPWGYFVAPGMYPQGRVMEGSPLRALWVGKLSYLKRVDTIVSAIAGQ